MPMQAKLDWTGQRGAKISEAKEIASLMSQSLPSRYVLVKSILHTNIQQTSSPSESFP